MRGGLNVQGTIETDVLVVGAGPGGSAAAYHLARHGIDVTLIEKAEFPREKVCGDGLTPRSVKAIQDMGVDTDDPRFERVIGLRVHARRHDDPAAVARAHDVPTVRTGDAARRVRSPAGRACGEGGRAAARADRGDRAGVRRRLRARRHACARGRRDGRAHRDPRPLRARRRRRGSRFGKPAGRAPRPGGRWASPRGATTACDYHPGPWIESWLDLWDGDLLLPGYGWLFPVAGGRINLGAGLLNTFANFKDISAQQLFAAFARMLPPEWGIDEDTAEGRVLSGPLPMGMNRTPPAVPGLLLVGDAVGRREPVQRRGHRLRDRDRRDRRGARPRGARHATGRRSRCSTRRCSRTPTARYFAIGRQFAKVIGKPAIMGRATAHAAAASRGSWRSPFGRWRTSPTDGTATCRIGMLDLAIRAGQGGLRDDS